MAAIKTIKCGELRLRVGVFFCVDSPDIRFYKLKAISKGGRINLTVYTNDKPRGGGKYIKKESKTHDFEISVFAKLSKEGRIKVSGHTWEN